MGITSDLAKIRFHIDNIVDDATLASSSAASAYPLKNLKNTFRKKSWRSTSGTEAWFTWDNGAGMAAIQALVLINHNLVAGDFRLELSDNADFSDPLLDVEFEAQEQLFLYGEGLYGAHGYGGYLTLDEIRRYSPDQVRVYYLDDIVYHRYGRLTLSEPASTGLSYLELGRPILGMYYEPAYGFPRKGIRLSAIDESEIAESKGGQGWIDAKPKRRGLEVEMPWIDPSETNWDMFDFLYDKGKRTPVFINPFPEDTPDLRFFWGFYCTLTDIPGIAEDDLLCELTSALRARESL